MSTDPSFADHVLDQICGAGAVSMRKMFGEYAVYCDAKVVALVCDNQVFLKPLPEALALVGDPIFAPPYPGAKPHLLLTDALDDPDLMTRLVRVVAMALPTPKPKKAKAVKKSELCKSATDQCG